MFQSHYNILGSAVVCKVIATTAEFSNESKITDYLKKITRVAGWAYRRVDTTNQCGFPDILLLKKDIYWQIEAKHLKKKSLVSLEDDLVYQFGQIAYMKRALARQLNYMLVVGKDNKLAFIKGVSNVNPEFTDYPDFARQI